MCYINLKDKRKQKYAIKIIMHHPNPTKFYSIFFQKKLHNLEVKDSQRLHSTVSPIAQNALTILYKMSVPRLVDLEAQGTLLPGSPDISVDKESVMYLTKSMHRSVQV